MEIFKKIAQQKRHLESLGYTVLYIGLYGSQNYSLTDNSSDIDLRAIVLPTLEQLIRKERISVKIETEMGQIDVKDLIHYHDVVRKGNFAFIEPMQTKWFIGDKYIRELFSDIKLNLKSLKFDMVNKAKAFRIDSPAKKVSMDKWGYDPKELHHKIGRASCRERV